MVGAMDQCVRVTRETLSPLGDGIMSAVADDFEERARG